MLKSGSSLLLYNRTVQPQFQYYPPLATSTSLNSCWLQCKLLVILKLNPPRKWTWPCHGRLISSLISWFILHTSALHGHDRRLHTGVRSERNRLKLSRRLNAVCGLNATSMCWSGRPFFVLEVCSHIYSFFIKETTHSHAFRCVIAWSMNTAMNLNWIVLTWIIILTSLCREVVDMLFNFTWDFRRLVTRGV